MKKSLLALLVLFSIQFYGQEKGNFFGGFESNSQWYLNDKGLGIEHPETPVRSHNFLLLNYKYKNWTAGIQAESYEDVPILNYNPEYKDTNIGTYFVQYKNEKIDVTAGYFYEQFGSGLLFRTWEDRALGINNALRGGRLIFTPTNYLTLKSIYGRQRSGFDVSDGEIFGSDLELDLSNLMKFEKTALSLGLTYIGRYEKTDIANPNFDELTNGFGGRLDFSHGQFYGSTEFDYKTKDAVVQVSGQVDNEFIKPGNALLVNLGYSRKGFGIDATFRRLENMSFYSERAANKNIYNDKIMNFIPSLTKQHHYNLSNIYVYQAQPNVILIDETLVKAGEIGGQVDMFYEFKKGSKIGGKHGTKIAVNISNWNALGGTFSINNPKDYDTDFFGLGRKYFSDYNVEVTKKWNDKWHTIFAYINQYYNKKLVEETQGLVKTNIACAEATYKFTPTRSLRVLGEHMWADHDKKNWASATVEFNANLKWSFYGTDLYNYGNDDSDMRNHYYNIGSAFRHKSTRIALGYGRQRGGLLCVGGVCRYVAESSGVTLSLNTSF